MALSTDWSPLSDFSLLGILSMLITLLIIDITKQTIPGYTFLLLFFNYYALKVALELVAEHYPKVKAKIRFLSTRTPMDCNIQDGFMLDEIQEAIDKSQVPDADGFDSDDINVAIEQSKKQEATDQERIWNMIKRGQQTQRSETHHHEFAEDDDLQAAIEQSKQQQVTDQERILAAINRGHRNQRGQHNPRGQRKQRGRMQQDGFAQDDIQAALEQSQAQAVIQQNRIQAAIDQGRARPAIDWDFGITTGPTTGQGLNWERVWTMLGDLTSIMARSRVSQLRADEHPEQILIGGTQEQIRALTTVLRDVEKRRDVNNAFLKFTSIDPSSKWIKAVEDFLSPRPTSVTELLFAFLEQLNASTIDCLEGAKVYRDRVFTQRFCQVKRILEQKDSDSRLQLLENTMELIRRATTPQLREDLYLILTARCNGLQSITRAIDLANALTPEALTGFRHKVSAGEWPAWLVPLLKAADDVLDTSKFDCIMQNTAALLHQVKKLSIQNYQYLRESISSSDNQVRMIQQQVVRNWRILVAKPRWNRGNFTPQLVPACGFGPEKAWEVVESLFLGYLEALETPEHGTYDVPNVVKELTLLELIMLNNVIVKQPSMDGLAHEIITLNAASDERDPPAFSDVELDYV
ncbi:hypothetical protein PG988_004728 [Apiospora saccharicola]